MVEGKLMCPVCLMEYEVEIQKDVYPEVRKLHRRANFFKALTKLSGYTMAGAIVLIYFMSLSGPVTAESPAFFVSMAGGVLTAIFMMAYQACLTRLHDELHKHMH